MNDTPAQTAAPQSAAPKLVLQRIQLAEYLNRSSMVTRLTPTEIEVQQLQQWAGSLADDTALILKRRLAHALPSKLILTQASAAHIRRSEQLAVTIHQFDGRPSESITLIASWQYFDKADQLILQKEFRESRPSGPSTQAMVTVMGELIESLADTIGQALSSQK
jgi:uncharacterized lipoprotein YmbA